MGVKVREWKGAWWVFVNHDRRRKAVRVGTGKDGKKLAQAAATKIQARLLDGDASVFEAPAPVAAVPTFAEVAEEWLTRYPALHAVRPTTMENYRSFTEHHLIPFFGALPITAVSAEKIEDFIEAKRTPGGSVRRHGKGLSDGSVRTGLKALRLILQRASRRGLIPANPMHNVEWRGAQQPEAVDPFTPAELRAILTAARAQDPTFAAMLQVWMQTGMRAGEVAGLQWQDLDLEAGTAVVQRTWSRRRLGPTKTGRTRVVRLGHPMTEETAEWRPQAAPAASTGVLAALRGLRVRSLDPDAFVFARQGQPWASQDVHAAWRRALAAARVRYRTPEQLRHTFASTLLSRNAPLLYVQQQGGWRTATVLLRTYARWMPQGDAAEPPAATPAQPAPLSTPTLRAASRG